MAFGGSDWLALTPEDPIEPDLPICDAHHHFYDLRYDRVPYQRYLLHELAADVNGGHNVRSTVFVNCGCMYREDGPEEMRPVGEVEFVQGMAAASASGLYGPARLAAAIIGHANLELGELVAPVLTALQAASPNRFRGIRQNPTQRQMVSEDFRLGARVLARMGFSLDIYPINVQQVRDLPLLADFARSTPELPIILDHLAWDPHPELASVAADNVSGVLLAERETEQDDQMLSDWKRGIAAVAACPNIYMKLGGLGMPRCGFSWHARFKPMGSEELVASMRSLMTFCIEQFGATRCMFESNFPVDKFSYSYTVMYNAFKRLTAGYSPAERSALFHDTAARVYRIAV